MKLHNILERAVTTLSDAYGGYGVKGSEISAGIAVLGMGISHLLGGWDSMVQVLVWFMAADFALGILAAFKTHKVDSQIMLWGGVNKVLVLLLVGLGVKLDMLVGMQEPYIRTAIIWFYIGREGLSLVENYGKLGNTLPDFLMDFFAQLKDKGDNGGTDK